MGHFIPYKQLIKYRNKIILALLALFTFIHYYVPIKIAFIHLNRHLNALTGDTSFSKFTYYDDSRVDTSRYVDEYIERVNAIADLVDQRNQDKFQYKTIRKNRRQSSLHKQEYMILTYTLVMGRLKYCQGVRSNDSFLEQCPYKNCVFSCDREDEKRADALLFHEYDLKRVETEASYYIKNLRGITAGQIWILWNDEPYISSQMNYYAFNWTMSYRLDSEVSDCSYGCKYSKANKDDAQFDSFVTEWRIAFYKRKRRAVWAASNCHSKRISYALDLHKSFPVQVLGKCVGYFDSPDSYLPLAMRNLIGNSEFLDCPRESECEKSLFETSKFYLAFESRNCTDYITEKMWRVLRTNMIPVVLQPGKEFYRQVAPPESFIHAEDFGFDMKLLAAYLHRVSTDFKTYLKHHAWKFEHEVVFTEERSERRRLCELCTKLNTESSEIYYGRVADWFESECSD